MRNLFLRNVYLWPRLKRERGREGGREGESDGGGREGCGVRMEGSEGVMEEGGSDGGGTE